MVELVLRDYANGYNTPNTWWTNILLTKGKYFDDDLWELQFNEYLLGFGAVCKQSNTRLWLEFETESDMHYFILKNS